MLPEDEKVFDSDNVGELFRIVFLDVSQDFDFNEGLLAELGLILDHLQRDFFSMLVVVNFEDLPV